MLEFSASLASKGLPTTVSSEADINTLMTAFEKEVRGLNLWQYYVLDPAKEKANVKAALTSGQITEWKGTEVAGKSVVEISQIVKSSGIIEGDGQLAARLGVHVDGAVAAGLAKSAFPNIAGDAEALADTWRKVVDVLNVPLYAEWEEDTKIALDSVKNRLKYTRLDEHGPRFGEITEKCVYSVFTCQHTLIYMYIH